MTLAKRTTITELITVLFIILFLYTGISKLTDYNLFKEQIAASPFLVPVAPFVAATLPWAEFAVVLLLIIPRWRKKGLYASLSFMIVFTLYIIAILLFDKNIPCSCGGVIELLSWSQHIVFNLLFIAFAVTALILEKKQRKDTKQLLASVI